MTSTKLQPCDYNAAVQIAVEAAGGARVLAEKLGVFPSAISNWRHDGIPPRRVPAIERLTGVPAHQLRSDLWEPPATDGAT